MTEESLLDLIHGKTMGKFTSAALSKAIPAPLKQRLLDANDLVPSWVQDGRVTTDGNTYTKV